MPQWNRLSHLSTRPKSKSLQDTADHRISFQIPIDIFVVRSDIVCVEWLRWKLGPFVFWDVEIRITKGICFFPQDLPLFRRKMGIFMVSGTRGRAAAWHRYVQHSCFIAEIHSKTPISGAFQRFVNKKTNSKKCFSVQLFKTARWSPLFMRVPEGYSLKSITLAREIKTFLVPVPAFVLTRPEKHYSRKRD